MYPAAWPSAATSGPTKTPMPWTTAPHSPATATATSISILHHHLPLPATQLSSLWSVLHGNGGRTNSEFAWAQPATAAAVHGAWKRVTNPGAASAPRRPTPATAASPTTSPSLAHLPPELQLRLQRKRAVPDLPQHPSGQAGAHLPLATSFLTHTPVPALRPPPLPPSTPQCIPTARQNLAPLTTVISRHDASWTAPTGTAIVVAPSLPWCLTNDAVDGDTLVLRLASARQHRQHGRDNPGSTGAGSTAAPVAFLARGAATPAWRAASQTPPRSILSSGSAAAIGLPGAPQRAPKRARFADDSNVGGDAAPSPPAPTHRAASAPALPADALPIQAPLEAVQSQLSDLYQWYQHRQAGGEASVATFAAAAAITAAVATGTGVAKIMPATAAAAAGVAAAPHTEVARALERAAQIMAVSSSVTAQCGSDRTSARRAGGGALAAAAVAHAIISASRELAAAGVATPAQSWREGIMTPAA